MTIQGSYDPADDSIRSYDLAIGAMRGNLIFLRQEGAQIFVCIGSDHSCEAIPVTLEKAADLNAELSRMVSFGLRARAYGNSEQTGLRD